MDTSSLIGIAVGVGLILGFSLYAIRKRSSVSLTQAALLYLSGTGFVAGVKVIVFSFSPELIALLKDKGIESSHILLGGVAICWASALSAVEVFNVARQSKVLTVTNSTSTSNSDE